MPNNPKVAEIYQRKLLEWADYTPDEINEIMQMEEEQRQALIQQAQQMAQMGLGPDGAPMNPNAPAKPAQAQLPSGSQPPTPPAGMNPPGAV